MVTLIELPDVIAPTIAWLTSLPEVLAVVSDRIGTQLPEEDHWPAVRIDPIGGLTILEYRLDQPRLQLGCFAESDRAAMAVARVVRAGVAAMAGYTSGSCVVVDVETTSLQLIETVSRNPALVRVPPISHATFAAIVTIRPDP